MKKRKKKSTGVDDVIVMQWPQFGTVEEIIAAIQATLREAFERLGARIDRKRFNLQSPITTRLIDSDGKCFWTIKMVGKGDDWKANVTDFDISGGVPMPYFLVAEDAAGVCMKVRVELDTQSPPA